MAVTHAKKNPWVTIKEYALVSVGLTIYALAWVIFLIPNHLVGGGVTGVATLIYYATGFPISISYFGINFILLIIALRTVGWDFGIKTIYGVLLASLLLQIVPLFVPQDLIQALALENGKLVAALIGGACAGAGLGMVLAQGGSSGGTDIVAQVINHYRNISPGRILLWCDLVIIGSSFFISDEPTIGLKVARLLYGYIIMGICSYTVDLVISGARRSVQFFIFSEKYEQIADRINQEMHRGVTVINTEGWYTKKEHKVLLVIVRHTQANKVSKIIKEIDKQAFISVGAVSGVYGSGFEVLKS